MAAPGGAAGQPRGRTVLQGGRPKAYRPLPPAERRAAFEAGLAAYARGDYFEAHELLEPAWMGSANESERELVQGLIKLAAAYVHAVRGNPLGMANNLRGARARLTTAAAGTSSRDGDAPAPAEVDLAALLAAIDERLTDASLDAPPVRRIGR